MPWKRQSKPDDQRLRDVVTKVSAFVRERLVDVDDVPPDFYPQVISAAVSESYLVVLAALSVLEDAGLVAHRYGIFCSSDDVQIAVEDSLEAAVAVVEECWCCERKISCGQDSAYVELFFVADRGKFLASLSSADQYAA